MKKMLGSVALATALSTQCVPAHAKPVETQNVCNSDIAVKGATKRTFALVQGFEYKINRLTLCQEGKVVMTSLISTGKPAMKYDHKTGNKRMRGSYTPEGNFRITERVEQWKTSNLYIDKKGRGAALPYWQRITNSGIGFHYGDVSNTSAGCIRVRYAQKFYKAITNIWPKNVEIIIQGTNPNTKKDGK